jgi:hypothetical protein
MGRHVAPVAIDSLDDRDALWVAMISRSTSVSTSPSAGDMPKHKHFGARGCRYSLRQQRVDRRRLLVGSSTRDAASWHAGSAGRRPVRGVVCVVSTPGFGVHCRWPQGRRWVSCLVSKQGVSCDTGMLRWVAGPLGRSVESSRVTLFGARSSPARSSVRELCSRLSPARGRMLDYGQQQVFEERVWLVSWEGRSRW